MQVVKTALLSAVGNPGRVKRKERVAEKECVKEGYEEEVMVTKTN